MLQKLRNLLAPRLESLEWPAENWDQQYSAEKWTYLSDISELARYSIIAGYVRFFENCDSILEIGCGTGLLYQRLHGTHPLDYTGVDISREAVASASQFSTPSSKFVVGDGRCFSDNRFYDVIVFNEALYYFDDCEAVLGHYARQLRPNGLFIISMVVGDISEHHWNVISALYHTVDSVRVANGGGISWNVKVLRPRK